MKKTQEKQEPQQAHSTTEGPENEEEMLVDYLTGTSLIADLSEIQNPAKTTSGIGLKILENLRKSIGQRTETAEHSNPLMKKMRNDWKP